MNKINVYPNDKTDAELIIFGITD